MRHFSPLLLLSSLACAAPSPQAPLAAPHLTLNDPSPGELYIDVEREAQANFPAEPEPWMQQCLALESSFEHRYQKNGQEQDPLDRYERNLALDDMQRTLLACFHDLAAKNPTYARRDEALYWSVILSYDFHRNNPFASPDETLSQLISEHPTSSFIPSAFLFLGDQWCFDLHSPQGLAYYSRIEETPRSEVYLLSLQHRTQCLMSMDQREAESAMLQAAGYMHRNLSLAERAPILASLYASVKEPKDAAAFFLSLEAKRDVPLLLSLLATEYQSRGDQDRFGRLCDQFSRSYKLSEACEVHP